MLTLLIVLIYIIFISLGLPDAILGSAWPSMYAGLNVPISYAGVISMIIAAGTIVSSLSSDRLTRKLGTAALTTTSVALTAVALLGFSFSNSFWMLCLWAVPYGLGAGSVDAALNNFVALNFKSSHMNWLHSFWGVGATLGPYVMGLCLTNNLGWNAGYRVIGVIQVVLVVLIVFSFPLWKQFGNKRETDVEASPTLTLAQTIRLPGAKNVFIAFFCYCSLEATAGLWLSSFLVFHKNISSETATTWASLFYLGITAGRLICGFISNKLGEKNMIRAGQLLTVLGSITLIFTQGKSLLIALVLIGLGCAPVYPSLLHQTPINFGAEKSGSIMGMQMASAYLGTTLMPPLFGILLEVLGISIYPLYLLLFAVVMVFMTEKMNIIRRFAKVESE